MHLQRLKLPAFRNLKDFEITFTEGVDDPNVEGGRRTFNSHAVIGANGAGKSNLLEAIIMIFRTQLNPHRRIHCNRPRQ